MDDKRACRIILAAIALAAVAAAQQAYGQDASGEPNTFPFQLLKWSAADQAAWVKTTLDKGAPPDLGGALTILAINKSSLVLPLMEQKIEEVLRSKSPSECFTEKAVNPERFMFQDAATIAYAGNDEAMRQVAKLVKLDERRFDDLVGRTLMETESIGNPENKGDPYIVAYHALEIGEPLVEKRIYAWVQARFSEKAEDRIRDLRKFWAEAIVERYGGVPTESQWATDPFVARLNPSDEPAVHKDLLGYAIAVAERRAKR